MARCQAVTKANKRCSKNALENSDYCGIASHQATAGSARGKKRKAESSVDEPSSKKARSNVLSYFHSGKESTCQLFRAESKDVLSNVFSFLPPADMFPARLIHPTWTQYIDSAEHMWQAIYTNTFKSDTAPLHFSRYDLDDLCGSFCEPMQKFYLKKSYMKLANNKQLLKMDKHRKCKTHFHFSKVQAKQLVKDLDWMWEGKPTVNGVIRNSDDGEVHKYYVKNLFTGKTFTVFSWTEGDTWVGKIHIDEQIPPYSVISDGCYGVATTDRTDTKDVPDREFLATLEEFVRNWYSCNL